MLEELLEAYRAAHYHVRSDPPFVLRIDEPSPGLDALLAACCVTDCAYLTAHNPRSQLRSPEENRRAHAALEAVLRARGLRSVPANSSDSQGGHHEEGVLVLGLDAEAARALGQRFGQAAVVSVHAGGRPQLIVCED